MSTIGVNQLRLLAIFAKVVETGSFAAAARTLNTSRSRVSEQVASLESTLNVRLIQRSTRLLSVTDEGKLVYEQAKKLAVILANIESDLYSPKPEGRVSITMPHHIAHLFISGVLKDFKQTYPDIELDLILDDYRLNLISDNVDLAIRVGVPKDESIIARVMHEEQVGLFASPNYLAEFGEINTIDDLQQCHWVLLDQSKKNSIQHMYYKNKVVDITPEHFYFCNSPFMIKTMLMKGLGIGKLLPNIASKEIENGELIPVMPSLTGQTVAFSLIYPSRQHIPLRIKTTIDYLLTKKIFR